MTAPEKHAVDPDGQYLGLPALEGSPRQVASAQNIRIQALGQALASLRSDHPALLSAACDQFDALLGTTSAAWWIDRRADEWDMSMLAARQHEREVLTQSPWISRKG